MCHSVGCVQQLVYVRAITQLHFSKKTYASKKWGTFFIAVIKCLILEKRKRTIVHTMIIFKEHKSIQIRINYQTKITAEYQQDKAFTTTENHALTPIGVETTHKLLKTLNAPKANIRSHALKAKQH
jgi:hypothetical protein